MNRGGEGVSHAQGRSILGNSISGTPKIQQNFDRADRNGKAVTHAEGRSISGTSILGVRRVPKIHGAWTALTGIGRRSHMQKGVLFREFLFWECIKCRK